MGRLISINAIRKAKEQKILDMKASMEILINMSKMLDNNNLEELKYIKKQIKITTGLIKKEIRKNEN